MIITRQLAESVTEHINRLNVLSDDLLYYLPMVTNEIEKMQVIKGKSPLWYGMRSLFFALTSPMSRFASNVESASSIHSYFTMTRLEDINVEDIFAILSDNKNGNIATGNVARALYSSRYFLVDGYMKEDKDGFVSTCLRENANNGHIVGAGPKVIAMASHLYNPKDRVFTLDTHMLRLIMKTVMDVKQTWEVKPNVYMTLEKAMIEWTQTYFPNNDLFAVQWAMWCIARKEFTSHLAIFKEAGY